MRANYHLKTFLILDHLEDFEPVTLAVGFAERDGKGKFNAFKEFIAPQIPRKPEADPTTGPLEETATEVVSQIAQHSSKSDRVVRYTMLPH